MHAEGGIAHYSEAFDRKNQRSQEISALTSERNGLKKATEDNEDALDLVKEDLKRLAAEEKLMIRRMRKYRLFPTAEQQTKLRNFMGTYHWTYNQAVAHFRKTNVYRADVLRDLYVTKTTRKTREYPEEMGSPPDWAFGTPKSFRYNTLRKFQTNVKSAFSNKRNGNISHFRINFKSRKESRFFTIYEDANYATIAYVDGNMRALLSISSLKDIPIRCDPGLEITNEIQITNTNGFWYAVIPHFVRPSNFENEGRCIALGPGLKAFMAGIDLNGNALHIGRGNRDHSKRLKNRGNLAQQEMAKIKNVPGHRSHKQWKAYARVKYAFNSTTAKMKNCVKEMHYQTCSFLTKHYDAIILPIFRTKQMVKTSSSRTHNFNETILSLKHFQFRDLLRAKCELLGKSLVVCFEMYTSQTCGSCGKLHLRLGDNDVFECSHCDHIAGRDVNAPFNILRFVCGGSLAISKVYC